jgi:hypothetical protein
MEVIEVHTGTFMDGLRKTTNISVKLDGIPVEIGT